MPLLAELRRRLATTAKVPGSCTQRLQVAPGATLKVPDTTRKPAVMTWIRAGADLPLASAKPSTTRRDPGPTEPHIECSRFLLSSGRERGKYYRVVHFIGGVPCAVRVLCVRCARAVRTLCEKLAVLHHREFGKFRRLKGRH